MLKLFCVTLTATRGLLAQAVGGPLLADPEQERFLKDTALRMCLARFPQADGWKGHHVSWCLVPGHMVETAYWELREARERAERQQEAKRATRVKHQRRERDYAEEGEGD